MCVQKATFLRVFYGKVAEQWNQARLDINRWGLDVHLYVSSRVRESQARRECKNELSSRA
ncbi:hypothetical protein Fmac_017210 [Flemingia macrophylla]|uniref:Uncharacterized protein n=1 Tax=Flemingia macrophylla TaxID=520843 RepID=A0ABD1M1G1_9FABA